MKLWDINIDIEVVFGVAVGIEFRLGMRHQLVLRLLCFVFTIN